MCYNQQTPDELLVKNYLQGDEAAFAVLLKRHQSKIFGKVLSVVRDRAVAQDIFQDALMKAVFAMKSGSYNEEGKFLPWVMRIAHNLCIDHFRARKKMPMKRGNDEYNPLDFVRDRHLNAEQAVVKTEVLEVARKLLAYLPDDQKEIVLMRVYFDMSFKEIADQLNISINTALGRMRYAKINLTKVIDEQNLDLIFAEV
jgi:RNA polymerase sigma-70 factor (ECF subfamily)